MKSKLDSLADARAYNARLMRRIRRAGSLRSAAARLSDPRLVLAEQDVLAHIQHALCMLAVYLAAAEKAAATGTERPKGSDMTHHALFDLVEEGERVLRNVRRTADGLRRDGVVMEYCGDVTGFCRMIGPHALKVQAWVEAD